MPINKFKIPKQVKIGAHIYTVYISPHGGETLGLCDHDNLEIFIEPRASGTQQAETFFHECLHAIFEQIGEVNDEQRVQRIAHAFYQLLADNSLLKLTENGVKINPDGTISIPNA